LPPRDQCILLLLAGNTPGVRGLAPGSGGRARSDLRTGALPRTPEYFHKKQGRSLARTPMRA